MALGLMFVAGLLAVGRLGDVGGNVPTDMRRYPLHRPSAAFYSEKEVFAIVR